MTVERFITLNPELHDYLVEHSSFRDGVAAGVEQAARKLLQKSDQLQITLLVIGVDYREESDLLRLEGVSLNLLD